MSRTARLLTCLLLFLTLTAAPTTLASPTDGSVASWWNVLSNLWNTAVTVAPGGEVTPRIAPEANAQRLTVDLDGGGNRGPDADPNGDALTNLEGGGNRGPEIDPDG